ncbi:MFS transporter [Gordonibacter sp. 28C]|uniref:MFS transporter n=1 Tax=Gordonibacter sp. 28C TaxID=2078569 RepID=UPI000DF74ED5|nr:MFS transporter [Gordonibacter sp. 28C]RDB61937.1 MFS transporter [Gordonibacter sp. 28C]
MSRSKAAHFVAVVCLWFSLYVYVPYQTPYLTGMGVAAGVVGAVIGAYGAMQIVLRIPLGVMADRLGRHRAIITAGVALGGAACVVRVLAPDEQGYLVASIISGCAASTWISFMVLYGQYYPPGKQQKATSIMVMACNLGMCLAFVFGTALYGFGGMPLLCTAGAVAGFAGVAASAFIRQDEGFSRGDAPSAAAVEAPAADAASAAAPPAARPGGFAAVRDLLSVCANRRLVLFAVLALVQQGVQMSTAMSFTTQILRDEGASAGFVGAASVFYMVAAVASAQFASTERCARRGPRFYVPLVFVLMGVYCVLVPAAGNIYAVFVLQALPGMSTGILLSYLTSESMVEVPPGKSSTAMGFFQAVYAVGMSLFPMIVGALAGWSSLGAGYAFLAAVSVAGALAAGAHYAAEARRTGR